MGAICNGKIINGVVMEGKIIFENPVFHIFSSLGIGAYSGSKTITTSCALYTKDGTFLDVKELSSNLLNIVTGYDDGVLTAQSFFKILEKEKANDFYLAWDSAFLVRNDYTSDGRFSKNHSGIYIHHAVISEEDIVASSNSIGLFDTSGKQFISGTGRRYSDVGDGLIKFNVYGTKAVNVSSGDSLIDSFNNKEV